MTGAPRRLRVMSIGHCAELSGAELALARVAPALRRRGIDLLVVLGEDGPLRERLSGTRVAIEPLPEPLRRSRRSGGRAVLSLGTVVATCRYAAHLAHLIAREGPDVVHCNTLKAAVYGALAARLAGKRSVWHIRDMLSPEQVGSRMVSSVLRLVARRLPNAVVANSAATVSAAGMTGRGTVIYDGVIVPARRAVPYQGGPLKGLIAGRLASWKGQDLAIAAVRRAREQGVDVRLTVAGAALFDADRAFEAELKVLGADGVAEGWLEFFGFVEDMEALYTSHHVAIHASRFPEPFGQVIIEAMSHGLPIIATRGGGPDEILTGELAACLVQPGEVDPIGAALVRLAAVDTWARLSRESSSRASHFSIEATAECLAAVFRSLAR